MGTYFRIKVIGRIYCFIFHWSVPLFRVTRRLPRINRFCFYSSAKLLGGIYQLAKIVDRTNWASL